MPLSKSVKTAKKVSKKVARSVASSKSLRKKTGASTAPAVKATAPAASKKVRKATKVTKTTTKVAPRTRRKSDPQDVNFTPGTDMAVAFEEVLKGGGSRADVSHRLSSMWSGSKTRNGNSKPVSTILNHVIRRALSTGKYEIRQEWKLVPKTDGVVVPATTTPPVASKKVTRKAGVAKVAKKAVRRRTAA